MQAWLLFVFVQAVSSVPTTVLYHSSHQTRWTPVFKTVEFPTPFSYTAGKTEVLVPMQFNGVFFLSWQLMSIKKCLTNCVQQNVLQTMSNNQCRINNVLQCLTNNLSRNSVSQTMYHKRCLTNNVLYIDDVHKTMSNKQCQTNTVQQSLTISY